MAVDVKLNDNPGNAVNIGGSDAKKENVSIEVDSEFLDQLQRLKEETSNAMAAQEEQNKARERKLMNTIIKQNKEILRMKSVLTNNKPSSAGSSLDYGLMPEMEEKRETPHDVIRRSIFEYVTRKTGTARGSSTGGNYVNGYSNRPNDQGFNNNYENSSSPMLGGPRITG